MSIKSKAIMNLAPGAVFSEHDGVITWQSPDVAQPNDSDVAVEMTRLESLKDITLLRHERRRKLRECDWTQFPDVPEATRTAWQSYRQALRDITDTYTSLDDVVWPSKPE